MFRPHIASLRALYPLFYPENLSEGAFLSQNLVKTEFDFLFGGSPSHVLIQDELPSIKDISSGGSALLVCDTYTEGLARRIVGDAGLTEIPILVLKSGAKSKSWESVQIILRSGFEAALGRDGLFIGVGGGFISDICAFAASIYMRGARLSLVSTSLLGMLDASLGGKTGVDLFGLKNLAGTFFPAGLVVLPLEALDSLPEREWKSGMAELIKTAILDSDGSLELTKKLISLEKMGRNHPVYRECLKECISMAISYKGRIVETDPRESTNERMLLNLGHTFGHALETVATSSALSHGEAVAWGIARACELGLFLGLTPAKRAREITGILCSYGYEISSPHPFQVSTEAIIKVMRSDKKRRAGKFRFIVPESQGARLITAEDFPALTEDLLIKILNGEYLLDTLS